MVQLDTSLPSHIYTKASLARTTIVSVMCFNLLIENGSKVVNKGLLTESYFLNLCGIYTFIEEKIKRKLFWNGPVAS